MKKVIIIGLTSLLLVVGCGKKKEEDQENKPNTNEPSVDNPTNITNENMIKDQTVEVLQFTNTGLVYNGNMTTLTSQVTNTSDQVVELTTVMATINYKDEYDNDRVLEMEVYFGESLNPGETRSVYSNTDVDLRKSSNIEYRIVR
ncbi:MAG: hypothetical protein HFI86_04305 [Bacilli bacterium]|nr:hypothetical protein [Bacilli bacterium]